MISKQDIEKLKCAIGSTDDLEHTMGVKSKSISLLVNTVPVSKQTSILDDNKYGPHNRLHWAFSRTQFPNLSRTLSTESDTNTSIWVQTME